MRVLSYVCDGRMGARPDLPRAIEAGLSKGVDVISAQGNGMDAGPYYLGAGTTGAPPNRSDLEPAIMGAKQHKIPFVLSLGGRAGGDAHLEAYLTAIDEIARSNGTRIRAAVISGEVSKPYLQEKLSQGVSCRRLHPSPRLSEWLTSVDVEDAVRIQAQMGAEPIIEALRLFENGEVDGVLTGRALDLGIHMAYPLFKGYPTAAAAHLAKVIECGGFCCDPPNPFTAVVGEITDDGITIEPALDELRCSAKSAASHALYERDNPFIERNPGGDLDISEAVYEQVSERVVRSNGATWKQSSPYTVKLEGVKRLGFEATIVAVVRDHALVPIVSEFANSVVRGSIADIEYQGGIRADQFTVAVNILGKSGALGPDASESVLLVRIAAPTQQAASYAANTIRVRLNQSNYPGRLTTAGNLALPFARGYLELGEAYAYNIWHLLPLDDPGEPFARQLVEFPRRND